MPVEQRYRVIPKYLDRQIIVTKLKEEQIQAETIRRSPVITRLVSYETRHLPPARPIEVQIQAESALNAGNAQKKFHQPAENSPPSVAAGHTVKADVNAK